METERNWVKRRLWGFWCPEKMLPKAQPRIMVRIAPSGLGGGRIGEKGWIGPAKEECKAGSKRAPAWLQRGTGSPFFRDPQGRPEFLGRAGLGPGPASLPSRPQVWGGVLEGEGLLPPAAKSPGPPATGGGGPFPATPSSPRPGPMCQPLQRSACGAAFFFFFFF